MGLVLASLQGLNSCAIKHTAHEMQHGASCTTCCHAKDVEAGVPADAA